jgi:hypothetical protein
MYRLGHMGGETCEKELFGVFEWVFQLMPTGCKLGNSLGEIVSIPVAFCTPESELQKPSR